MKLLNLLFVAIFIITFYLIDYCCKKINKLSSPNDINKLKRLSEGSLCLIIIVIIWFSYDSIHKFKSFYWLPNLAIMIVSLHSIWIAAKIRYLLRTPYDLIGKFYIRQYISEVEKDISKAEAAVVKACAFNPQNPYVWILRASFTDEHKGDIANAYKFLKQAETLIEHTSMPNKELLAQYEFCHGSLLISQEHWLESLIHLRKSQELVFTSEKADFIKKIESQIGEET
jgi:hypothetical protein